MRYQRWLAVVLLPFLTPHAHAQLGGASAGFSSSGNVHVHVVFANDRRAGANLLVRLMQGSSSTPEATTYTNDTGQADFRNVPLGMYHVSISGDGIEATDSELFEVDARKATQSEYVTVRQTQGADAKTENSKSGTVSASALKVPAKARQELDKASEAISRQEWSKAAELLNKAIAIYPEYAAAYNNLGVVYAGMSDLVHEQQALEKAVSLDERFAAARQNLVKVYLRQKAYPQAETLLGKGLSIDPNNGQYLMLMADVQYVQGHYDAAIATAQKVHALPNDHPATAHYIAAKAYERENRPKEALAEFQTFLKEEPTGPRADHVRDDMAKMQVASAQ
jgi:tetratricopeptide (TPR) repeat protein